MAKVFLGGTTSAGTTWRETMIPYLEEQGLEYFNPVVDDWNDAARERELKERKECEFCLYVITPRMEGFYSVAEVVDDSNKRPEKTVFIVLEEDDGVKWTEHQRKSMAAIEDLVSENGACVYTRLCAAAASMAAAYE